MSEIKHYTAKYNRLGKPSDYQKTGSCTT